MTFKFSSHLRRFRKSDHFDRSFASISLNTNMFFMKIYHNQELLVFHNSVKLEYSENLKENNIVILDTF